MCVVPIHLFHLRVSSVAVPTFSAVHSTTTTPPGANTPSPLSTPRRQRRQRRSTRRGDRKSSPGSGSGSGSGSGKRTRSSHRRRHRRRTSTRPHSPITPRPTSKVSTSGGADDHAEPEAFGFSPASPSATTVTSASPASPGRRSSLSPSVKQAPRRSRGRADRSRHEGYQASPSPDRSRHNRSPIQVSGGSSPSSPRLGGSDSPWRRGQGRGTDAADGVDRVEKSSGGDGGGGGGGGGGGSGGEGVARSRTPSHGTRLGDDGGSGQQASSKSTGGRLRRRSSTTRFRMEEQLNLAKCVRRSGC